MNRSDLVLWRVHGVVRVGIIYPDSGIGSYYDEERGEWRDATVKPKNIIGPVSSDDPRVERAVAAYPKTHSGRFNAISLGDAYKRADDYYVAPREAILVKKNGDTFNSVEPYYDGGKKYLELDALFNDRPSTWDDENTAIAIAGVVTVGIVGYLALAK